MVFEFIRIFRIRKGEKFEPEVILTPDDFIRCFFFFFYILTHRRAKPLYDVNVSAPNL